MKVLCEVDDIAPLLKASGLTLREHQKNGIETILKWINNNHGGILADEMGLGKTCQAVMALALAAKSLPSTKFLIICPLSVIEHWENELTRFGCGILKIFTYKGYKETREKLRSQFLTNDWNICLTTYNYFRIDNDYFNFPIEIVIIDEAHSVKSQQSQLHQLVRKKKCHFHLLLTGTPIQNNLSEFYSLLSLADNKEFDESPEEREKFFQLPRKELEIKLKEATEKYVLRRLKSEVCKELPSSQEVILLHSLTNYQKQLYNAVLVANHGFFEQTTSQRQSLMNVLAQLRKAVAHPYLFPGIEPTPFTEGEHLITASGKFMVVDKLLKFLKASNHRCLIFSQYSRNLEILADALSFRGYKYEHLDGSTKAEDRFQSIENFQRPDSDIFCFLISTKAGGQGLTLTAADTVIFLDSDYNPQNDLQAAARCHRIGQDKPVKVIRLLAEHTIDNVIRKRAEGKLKLSDFVLDDNSGSLSANVLREVLLSDLAELNKVPDCGTAYSTLLTDEYFIEQIGKTDENGHWINESVTQPAKKKIDDEEEDSEVQFFPRSSPISKLSKDDEKIFDKLKADLSKSDTVITKAVKGSAGKSSQSSADREQQLKQRRDAAKARREALERKRLEEKMKLWEDNDYETKSVTELLKPLKPTIDPEPGKLYRVYGSVTNPVRGKFDHSKEAWLIHCVDTGGRWGHGGLFNALNNLSPTISESYEKSGEMKDLHCGDSHFISNIIDERESKAINIKPEIDLNKDAEEAKTIIKQRTSVMLLIAQTLRDRHRMIINESSLKRCFKLIVDFGLTRTNYGMPSIHMAMIWWGLPYLNEKIVCNLIVKELCQKGCNVYVYHYTRNRNRKGPLQQPQQLALKTPKPTTSPKKLAGPPAKKRKLTVAVVDDDEEEEKIETDDESEKESCESEEESEEEMDLDLTESEEEDETFNDDDEEE